MAFAFDQIDSIAKRLTFAMQEYTLFCCRRSAIFFAPRTTGAM
jgi:hypothetical protein